MIAFLLCPSVPLFSAPIDMIVWRDFMLDGCINKKTERNTNTKKIPHADGCVTTPGV